MKKFYLLAVLTALLCCQVQAKWQMKQSPLMTKWASEIDINNPLPEYPRPQLVREQWLNLNGLWQFQSGTETDQVPSGKTLSDEILVPFAMESAISGVMAHHERSWYRRVFTVPMSWSGKEVILHLGAVDWESEVFINGKSVILHQGGYDPISVNITPYLNNTDQQELIVRVYDPTDNRGYPRGKQTLHTGGIMYTSVSGIWQSVWLEPVAGDGVSNLKMTPDIDTARLNLRVNTFTDKGQTVNIIVKDNNKTVTTLSGKANTDLAVAIPDQKLWSPDNPFLYDLEVSVQADGKEVDMVKSYFGMRKSSLGRENGVLKMFLNNQFVFQMGPLDQGWWPDGLYTAPTDEALKFDIIKTKEFGFNMTRKHIKVEPARWYYWADKLGLMVWQDMPSVNSYTSRPQPIETEQFKLELNRMIDNLWNCPSIISWVVFNESQGIHNVKELVDMVKAKDPSRLVNCNSGTDNATEGDIFDVHSYPPPSYPNPANENTNKMARVCGEYGGIGYIYENRLWNPNRDIMEYSSVTDVEEFFRRYKQYNTSLLDFKVNQGLSAAVYTEITDVENETNGLMTYDRVVKVSESRVADLNKMLIHGDLKTRIVMPNAREKASQWAYTTIKPASDWFKPDFNDSNWKRGQGGFGAENTPNAAIGTKWNTSDIWLRKSFKLESCTPEEINNMCLNIFHDENYDLYINGILASSGKGFTTNYVIAPLSDTGKAALKPNAINTIAIKCSQTIGGQFIDTGMMIFQIINNSK